MRPTHKHIAHAQCQYAMTSKTKMHAHKHQCVYRDVYTRTRTHAVCIQHGVIPIWAVQRITVQMIYMLRHARVCRCVCVPLTISTQMCICVLLLPCIALCVCVFRERYVLTKKFCHDNVNVKSRHTNTWTVGQHNTNTTTSNITIHFDYSHWNCFCLQSMQNV